MYIHGVRIYPQSVEAIQGKGATIYVHGSVSEECTDFFYILRPLVHLWQSHFFVQDFDISYEQQHGKVDPLPDLRERFGSSLVAADVDSQLMLLRGDDFERWGAEQHFCGGAFLPIFSEMPSFHVLKRLFWNRDYQLTSTSWPAHMRAALHMWDDMYWQLFTTQRSDIDMLIEAHRGDTKLKMYFVELDDEYPNPSNRDLEPVP